MKITRRLGLPQHFLLMALPAVILTSPAIGASHDASAIQESEAKQGTVQSSESDKATKDGMPLGKPPVSFLIVPIKTPEHNAWMKKGCWAKFYDNTNFTGDMLTLIGPVDMTDMAGPFGIDWKGKITSVESGSAARVLVYDNEGFKDLVATFKPGQKVSDVSKKLGFFDEFSSLKITCDNLKNSKAKSKDKSADK